MAKTDTPPDDPMTGLMDKLQRGLQKDLTLARDGNQITVVGVKQRPKPKAPTSPASTPKASRNQSPSPQALQEVADAKLRAKEEKAPTTKTEMGKFKKGGRVRGDGCAQRGKTRGRMV